MPSKPRLGDYFFNRQEPGREGLPVMSVTMNDSLVLRDELERRTESALRPNQHLLVRKGDIAYNMMRMWQGACGLAEADGIVSPAYVVLAPKPGIDSRFAYQWFKSERMIHLFWAYSHGLTEDRLRLYFDEFAEIPATPPSLDEQRRSVAVLETWDRVIEQMERLVAAKRRQRLTTIRMILRSCKNHEALGSVVSVVMGQSPLSEAYNSDGNGLPLVQGAGDFDEWELRPTGWTTSTPKSTNSGTIIMSVRAPVGLAVLADREVCLGRGVCALRAASTSDADFILANLLTAGERWVRLSQGTSFEAIGTDQLDEYEIAWPDSPIRTNVGGLHRALFEEERALTRLRNNLLTQKRGLMQKLLMSERRLDGRFDPQVAALMAGGAA